ncbi:MAG: cytochrome c1, partial [Sedimenticola sp.]
VGEPIAVERKRIGTYVLIFIAIFFVLSYLLKKEYWKDVH